MKRHEPKNKWIAGVCSTSVKHSLAALVKQSGGGICGVHCGPIIGFNPYELLRYPKSLCCLDCDDSYGLNHSLGCIPLCYYLRCIANLCCSLVAQPLQDRAARPGCKIGTRITQEPQNETFSKTISGHCFCRSFSLRSVCRLETFVLLLLFLLLLRLLLLVCIQHTYTLSLFTSLCFFAYVCSDYSFGGRREQGHWIHWSFPHVSHIHYDNGVDLSHLLDFFFFFQLHFFFFVLILFLKKKKNCWF